VQTGSAHTRGVPSGLSDIRGIQCQHLMLSAAALKGIAVPESRMHELSNCRGSLTDAMPPRVLPPDGQWRFYSLSRIHSGAD
jgi:hypothetical protein